MKTTDADLERARKFFRRCEETFGPGCAIPWNNIVGGFAARHSKFLREQKPHRPDAGNTEKEN